MIDMAARLEYRQESSTNAYKKNLDQKVQMAKESNSRMDAVARRAHEIEGKKIKKKYD